MSAASVLGTSDTWSMSQQPSISYWRMTDLLCTPWCYIFRGLDVYFIILQKSNQNVSMCKTKAPSFDLTLVFFCRRSCDKIHLTQKFEAQFKNIWCIPWRACCIFCHWTKIKSKCITAQTKAPSFNLTLVFFSSAPVKNLLSWGSNRQPLENQSEALTTSP